MRRANTLRAIFGLIGGAFVDGVADDRCEDSDELIALEASLLASFRAILILAMKSLRLPARSASAALARTDVPADRI